MYNLAMGLEGRIFDATLLAQATLPPAAALMLWRHLNAAHILLYMGVSAHYTADNLLLPLNELYQLLSPAELARLTAVGFSGGTASREVLSWAVTGVQAQYKAGVITDIEKAPLMDQLLRFRATFGSLFDFQDLPFPFIYVSFVTVVCHLYPALFSATVALCFGTTPGEPPVWAHEIIAFLATLLNTVFFTGLHGSACFARDVVLPASDSLLDILPAVASKLQDPFENGPEDLSVLHFVRFTCQASAKVLLRAPPPLLDAAAESALSAQRNWGPNMGAAFDTQSMLPAAKGDSAPAGEALELNGRAHNGRTHA